MRGLTTFQAIASAAPVRTYYTLACPPHISVQQILDPNMPASCMAIIPMTAPTSYICTANTQSKLASIMHAYYTHACPLHISVQQTLDPNLPASCMAIIPMTAHPTYLYSKHSILTCQHHAWLLYP